jgi:hypothetical protein
MFKRISAVTATSVVALAMAVVVSAADTGMKNSTSNAATNQGTMPASDAGATGMGAPMGQQDSMTPPSLDGTSWKAELSGNKKKHESDQLVFKNGQFTSTECVPYGFNGGAYEITNQSGQSVWTSTQKNKKGETMTWQGTWDGKSNTMSGEYKFMNKKGKLEEQTGWTATKS